MRRPHKSESSFPLVRLPLDRALKDPRILSFIPRKHRPFSRFIREKMKPITFRLSTFIIDITNRHVKIIRSCTRSPTLILWELLTILRWSYRLLLDYQFLLDSPSHIYLIDFELSIFLTSCKLLPKLFTLSVELQKKLLYVEVIIRIKFET